ncbi:MAG: hypothetical protein H6665_07705 [Ardenticatenaceae bacterium]|nr:hypothetical protein [Ardenticatenaceae bacterium]
MPTTPCNEELLALARDPNAPAIWRIVTPRNGEAVSGVLPIVGTADFDTRCPILQNRTGHSRRQ